MSGSCAYVVSEKQPRRGLSMASVGRMLASLHPAYFALVMATGIVSIDCHLFGLHEFSRLLYAINCPAYVILWLLYAARTVLFTREFAADWFSHKRAFGFFTVVAASNVLGAQVLLLDGNTGLALGLWWLALILWVACTYCVFIFLVVKPEKPALEDGINGGWLVAVVATQSLCVLGAQLHPWLFGEPDFAALVLLSLWLFGGMLYIWLISLIFYRYMFFRFEPSDLIPPYWINMGAMAISTLAGAELVIRYASVPPVTAVLPFVKGMTILYWATATWWIPMLFGLGLWRHAVCRFKFTYDPLYWGLVFPFGMYSVCTLKLAQAIEISALITLSHVFLFGGLLAWFFTFMSMAQRPLFALVLAARVLQSRLCRSEEDRDE